MDTQGKLKIKKFIEQHLIRVITTTEYKYGEFGLPFDENEFSHMSDMNEYLSGVVNKICREISFVKLERLVKHYDDFKVDVNNNEWADIYGIIEGITAEFTCSVPIFHSINEKDNNKIDDDLIKLIITEHKRIINE